ncbi:MAG TPA: hypothetical protein VLW85_02725, partial [Myxococcales bacterium]|nr:hypothetical protein [Myxococcales bacterium]
GSTAQQADKKLTVDDLQPGPVFVVVHEPWRTGDATSFRLTPIFKPADPDAARTTCKTQATARELPAEHGRVEDSVDYSAMRRTCWWHIALAAEGGLSIKLDNGGANLLAEFSGAQGMPEKIDPAAGLAKADLPAGDYWVKVYANDAGDSGRYSLTTSFTPGDTCKNGGEACAVEGAEPLALPSDSKSAEVDYSGRQFHFYKVSLAAQGRLTIDFKALQRGSRISAAFLKAPDDDGEPIAGSSAERSIDAPGDYFIRVQAPQPGDAGKYALSISWQPAATIAADVVEIGQSPCMLTVSAGSNQKVRPGEACTVTAATGKALESCVVESVFANLSEVRPLAGSCALPDGARVQITASP